MARGIGAVDRTRKFPERPQKIVVWVTTAFVAPGLAFILVSPVPGLFCWGAPAGGCQAIGAGTIGALLFNAGLYLLLAGVLAFLIGAVFMSLWVVRREEWQRANALRSGRQLPPPVEEDAPPPAVGPK